MSNVQRHYPMAILSLLSIAVTSAYAEQVKPLPTTSTNQVSKYGSFVIETMLNDMGLGLSDENKENAIVPPEPQPEPDPEPEEVN